MSTTTKNRGLLKPELTDSADITAYNSNWDKIDTELYEIDVALDNVDATFEDHSNRISSLNTKIDSEISEVNTEISNVDSKLDTELNKVNSKLDTINSKVTNPDTTPIDRGGTGATTASQALSNLGAVPTVTFNNLQNNTNQHFNNTNNPHNVTAEQVGLLPLNEIPELYVWKRYTGNPLYSVSSKGEGSILLYGTMATVTYADKITIKNGTVSLVNPKTDNLTSVTASSFNKYRGKYVDGTAFINYIYPSSTFTIEPSQYTSLLKGSEVSTITVGNYNPDGFVTSKDENAYQNGVTHTDNYFYEYQCRLGENPYTYGTEELTEGESELKTGTLYFVYE